MIEAAADRRQRELRQLAVATAYAVNAPNELDKAFHSSGKVDRDEMMDGADAGHEDWEWASS